MSSNTVKTSLVLVLYTGGTIGMKKRNENGTFQGYLPYATVFLFYGPDCRYHAGVNPLSRIKKVLTKLACLQTLHFLFRDHRAHICAIREILRMAFIFELPPLPSEFPKCVIPLMPTEFPVQRTPSMVWYGYFLESPNIKNCRQLFYWTELKKVDFILMIMMTYTGKLRDCCFILTQKTS